MDGVQVTYKLKNTGTTSREVGLRVMIDSLIGGNDGVPANFKNLTPADIKKSGLDGIATRHGYKVTPIGLSRYFASRYRRCSS